MLIFIGGIIILFLYIASLTNEVKIRLNYFHLVPSMLPLILLLSNINSPYPTRGLIEETSVIYNCHLLTPLLLLSFLIALLLIVVKGLSHFKGALAKKL
jgi:hypothetical protein